MIIPTPTGETESTDRASAVPGQAYYFAQGNRLVSERHRPHCAIVGWPRSFPLSEVVYKSGVHGS